MVIRNVMIYYGFIMAEFIYIGCQSIPIKYEKIIHRHIKRQK